MVERLVSSPEQGIYIAESADVVCSVKLGNNVSIWYQAVVRGDVAPIEIGEGTNIQDSAIVHVAHDYPTYIGQNVTVGHGAIIHGCTIGDNTLIGMGAIILNGAVIGSNCIIGAGSLVTQRTVIPDGCLVFGSPAKVIRQLNKEEIESNKNSALKYMKFAREHFS